MRRPAARLVLGAVAVLVASMAPSSATASDDEVRKEGSCQSSSDWEMRARWDSDDRIEIRGKVDHAKSDQRWTWKIKHNGSISAQGGATTRGGEFEVRRSLVDLPGIDHCTFRAVLQKTGEVCKGIIDW